MSAQLFSQGCMYVYTVAQSEAPLLVLCTFIDLTLNFQPGSLPDSKVNICLNFLSG